MVLSVTNHELSARLQQRVDLVVDLSNGSLGRLAHVDRRLHEHALVEGLVEGLLVADELGQLLDLVLSLHIATNDALSGGQIILDGRKHVLISYVARVAQIDSLRPVFFAARNGFIFFLLLIFKFGGIAVLALINLLLLHGILEV